MIPSSSSQLQQASRFTGVKRQRQRQVEGPTAAPPVTAQLLQRAVDKLKQHQYQYVLDDLAREMPPLNPGQRFCMLVIRGSAKRHLGLTAAALLDLDAAMALEAELLPLDQNTEMLMLYALVDRSIAHTTLNNYDLATLDLDKARQLKPDHHVPLLQYGRVKRLSGRLLEALADLNLADRLKPHDARILKERGGVLRLLGHLPEALADLDRALTLNPGNAAALSQRGIVMLGMGRYADAVADLEQAGDASNRMLYIARSLCKYEANMVWDALRDIDTAIAVGPVHDAILIRIRIMIKRTAIQRMQAEVDADVALANRLQSCEP